MASPGVSLQTAPPTIILPGTDRRPSGGPQRRGEPRQAWNWKTTPADLGRRLLNVGVASLGIILTAPVLALIALAVKLSSPGPAIYAQERVGLDRRAGSRRQGRNEAGRRQGDSGGRIFTIYKFRTMRCDQAAKQVWARKDDPRITPVGRFLRRYRLDELPQLFNVLKGDMNLVGPRPEQPEIFLELRRELSEYQQRQKVLPGITGWAQIHHHYDQCLDDVKKKVGLDLQYIDRRSVVQDLRIMMRTLPVMVGRKGAV